MNNGHVNSTSTIRALEKIANAYPYRPTCPLCRKRSLAQLVVFQPAHSGSSLRLGMNICIY
jgi:hypothetical protein